MESERVPLRDLAVETEGREEQTITHTSGAGIIEGHGDATVLKMDVLHKSLRHLRGKQIGTGQSHRREPRVRQGWGALQQYCRMRQAAHHRNLTLRTQTRTQRSNAIQIQEQSKGKRAKFFALVECIPFEACCSKKDEYIPRRHIQKNRSACSSWIIVWAHWFEYAKTYSAFSCGTTSGTGGTLA